ncbi:MAG: hypothetical protein WAK93_20185 [Solirubrobacteraceae bacterium]
MGIQRRVFRRVAFTVAGGLAALATAGPASAFQPLPAAGRVNDDVAAGIDPALSVNGEDPANADVVGGALTAGKVAVPWAIFGQEEASGDHDQIFSRSFAADAWTTRGSGTVGGRSSAGPLFGGSLNFDQTEDGEAPAIDFAGAGRTVPWASWYENTSGGGFANNNVFASRFDNTGDANQGKWIFAGQGRGNGGGGVPVPSLNIHTNQNAKNPSVAGGSAADPTKPAPWITWQETSTASGHPDQIFVVRPEGPGAANCDGVTPAGVADGSGHVPAIGGFCWQQTGIPRFGTPALDPTLNVDPTRNGIEPDIAFTGASDAVPWVVWYETGTSGTAGLHGNELVFAAKGVANGAADGGFAWQAVGTQLSAALDTTDTCGASATNEAQCSLNANPTANAEDPRVAAGTMTPGASTVPWIAWDETVGGGAKEIFVARLVGSGATAHFALANGNSPISTGTGDSTAPDITFSGNTPYVSWREDVGGGVEHAFVGHFVDASSPTFRLDESDVPLTPTTQANVREPISSSCIANPFNGDGSACQGGALGTPFFLSTSGMNPSPLGLFADAYQPTTPATGAASAVTAASATVGGSIDPAGAPVRVSFQFGTTTAYGLTTPAQTLGPGDSSTGFTAALSALPPGATIHYRTVATTDFGTLVGADQTFVTATPTPAPQPGVASAGRARVSGTTATVPVTCSGATSCRVAVTLTVHETLRGRKIIAVTAGHTARRKHKLVLIGSSSATVAAGHTAKLHVKPNRTGRRLLSARHRLTATLTVNQRTNGKIRRIARRKVTLKAPRARRRRQH